MNFENIDKKYLIILLSLSSSAIFAFFTNIYLARFLGPYNFGIFSGSIALAIFFGGISLLGLDGFLQNIFGEEKKKYFSMGSYILQAYYHFTVLLLSIYVVMVLYWST